MGQILGLEVFPDFLRVDNTNISMATTYQSRQVRVTVGGQQYTPTSALTLNFSTVGMNGIDTGAIAANTLYYIYGIRSAAANVFGLIASTRAPNLGPLGFSSWKELGRCRTVFSAAVIATVISKNTSQIRDIDWASILVSGFTVSQNMLNARAVRDKVQIGGRFTLSNSLGTAALITLPPYMTSRPGGGGGNGFIVGKWARNNASAGSVKQGLISAFPGDLNLGFSIDDTSNTSNPLTNLSSNNLFSPTDTIVFNGEAVIPVYELLGLFD